MSIESELRAHLRQAHPDANVYVATPEADASPPDRDTTADEINVTVGTVAEVAYGGEPVYNVSAVTVDLRSVDTRRAKAMSAAVQALAEGTPGELASAFRIEAVGSDWEIDRGSQRQFRSVESLTIWSLR